jgi:hypothetical protein
MLPGLTGRHQRLEWPPPANSPDLTVLATTRLRIAFPARMPWGGVALPEPPGSLTRGH